MNEVLPSRPVDHVLLLLGLEKTMVGIPWMSSNESKSWLPGCLRLKL
jgi:hypothetical protein